MRVSVVHEWLTNRAGSEKVVEQLQVAFPDAPVYTSVFWPANFDAIHDVETSFLQRFVRSERSHITLAPLLPIAMASLRLPPSDLVITNFHNFSTATRVPAGTPHIVYCQTPTRFVHARASMADERAHSTVMDAAARVWGIVDRRLGRRGDLWVGNSRHIAERIRRAYGHEARVIHPPVDVEMFRAARTTAREDYFLYVGRLVPYKRADLAVEAFREIDAPLLIVGEGRDRARLEQLAPPNVRFLGVASDAELPGLMARARALVFPGEEDFGITPVEAMAAGTPVIAYGSGGALDTVVSGESGLFFDAPTAASLAAAVDKAMATSWDASAISASAERFSNARFVDEWRALALEVVGHP